jgi:hypothetical protein
MKAILTTLIAIVTVSFLQANNVNYGLYFKSYADIGKDRTSLVVNKDKVLKIKNETTISFDMYIRKEMEFGYIVHIISDSGDKIALNFSADNRNNRNVSLSRLKLLLENIEDISLLNNSGFWRISFGKDGFCDYQTSLLHIREFKANDRYTLYPLIRKHY